MKAEKEKERSVHKKRNNRGQSTKHNLSRATAASRGTEKVACDNITTELESVIKRASASAT